MSPSLVAEQEVFNQRVKTWVVERLREGDNSLGAIVRALPGVDPTLVAAALGELGASCNPLSSTAQALLTASGTVPPTAAATTERPVPHPLDFYWAFTPESGQQLLDEIGVTTGPGDLIAYLGTPNLFRGGAERLADRDHVLLDRSIPHHDVGSTPAVRTLSVDLIRDELPALDADLAILDPPWYPAHIRGFLWAAARVTKPGATILTTLPPPGTRPRAVAEVAAILDWAEKANHLTVVWERARALRYQSPSFELASHRAAGLGGIPRDWRVGDLACLRRSGVIAAQRPTPPADDGAWRSYIINAIPLRVRSRAIDTGRLGSPLFESIVAGDVLQSVSSRDPIRDRIDVWTSLNRVWASPYPAAVQAICRALAEGGDPFQAVAAQLRRHLSPREREHVRHGVDHLAEIVAYERREHRL